MEPHHPIDPDRIDWKKLKNALKTGGTTRLYAFRAHLRGRSHFAKNTNLALARWIDGVPIETVADATLPGGWRYGPITRDVIEKWVKDLYAVFAATPAKAAG